MKLLTCVTTGGMTSQMKSPAVAMSERATVVIARTRFMPRRTWNSIKGLSPAAKKIEMINKMKTSLADASARSSAIATNAPLAARKPK